jgi:hypothetical protein
VSQYDDGCTEVGGCIIPELDDTRVAIEGRLHDSTLYAATSAVHDTDLAAARVRGVIDVLFHDRGYVMRRERVEINLGFDRNANGIEFRRHAFFS